jgi:ribosomal protein S18 acetylase RimI-like enzyme
MKIQKLSIADYERIIDLWSRAGLPFKPCGRDSRKAMTAQMAANPQFFLGAFVDKRLVGIVIISSDTRKGWINRLAVDPEHRHCGVAKALIRESEKVLRKQGIRIFCALVDDENAVSKELFKSCGYHEHRDIIYYSKHRAEDI